MLSITKSLRLLLCLSAVMLILAGACAQAPPSDDSASQDEATADPGTESAGTDAADATEDAEEEDAADVYTVRGEVLEVPVADNPASAFRVYHESIDDMKGIGGEVWGMDAMPMEFSVADGVALDGVAAGDKVQFELRVEWLANPPQEIISLAKLPAGTELDLGKKEGVEEDTDHAH